MKKSFALYLVLVVAGATFASATSLPVILNPDFTPNIPLLTAQPNNDPDSWLEPSSGLVVPDWNFSVYTFPDQVALNLSGIAGPDFSASGGTPDYIHFTTPPDGASQFAFLSSGSYVDQLVTGFQTGKAYILTFSAESWCYSVDPITVSFNGVEDTTEYPTQTTGGYPGYPSGWETFSLDFTANSSTEKINFFTGSANYPDINSNGPFVALSDPVIAATPEPGSLLLFATGLLGLAFMGQMRSRKNRA